MMRVLARRLALGVAFIVGAAHTVVAQTHLVIVSGLGGEKKYTTEFNDVASRLADAAQKRWASPTPKTSGSAKTASPRIGRTIAGRRQKRTSSKL